MVLMGTVVICREVSRRSMDASGEERVVERRDAITVQIRTGKNIINVIKRRITQLQLPKNARSVGERRHYAKAAKAP